MTQSWQCMIRRVFDTRWQAETYGFTLIKNWSDAGKPELPMPPNKTRWQNRLEMCREQSDGPARLG